MNFCFCRKGGNVIKRGRVNLIGRLQLATEKSREEDNEGITQLRIYRTQVDAVLKDIDMDLIVVKHQH